MIFKDYLLENIENIKSLFLNSFVNKIMELSKSDYILYFSKNKEYGLVLSINNNEPFLKVINQKLAEKSCNFNDLKTDLINELLPFLSEKTGRIPIILPIIMDIKNYSKQ